MFEKEVKEIVMQKVIEDCDCIMSPCKTLEDCQLVDFCFNDMIEICQKGTEFGYNKGYHDAEEHYMNVIDSQHKLVEESKVNKWHYVTDELPPNPKESEDGKSILPLNYICAYNCGDDDYECDEFMYLGDGVWNGENKRYPIYAWMEGSVEVLRPREEK